MIGAQFPQLHGEPMRHSVGVPALLLFLAGCAATGGDTAVTPPTRSTVTASATDAVAVYQDNRTAIATLDATPERVWSVLPAVYEQLGIPVTTLLPQERTLGNKQASVVRRLAGERPSVFLDCGVDGLGLPFADRYRITLSAMSTVEPGATGTSELQTRLNATAVQQGASGDPVLCNTTGRLEKQIVRLAQERLRGSDR